MTRCQAYPALVVAAGLLLLTAATNSPTPLRSHFVSPVTVPTVFELHARFDIPDNGEFLWPVTVPYMDVADSFTEAEAVVVRDVRVELRGLYHEFAGDLRSVRVFANGSDLNLR